MSNLLDLRKELDIVHLTPATPAPRPAPIPAPTV